MTPEPSPWPDMWMYCPLCRVDMIVCGLCGNNSCNGGYGEINGEDCPHCPEVYERARAELAPPGDVSGVPPW